MMSQVSPRASALSTSLSVDTTLVQQYRQSSGSRTRSEARRRWVSSMHALYTLKLFESFIHNPFYSLIFSLQCFGIAVDLNIRHRKWSAKTQLFYWLKRIGGYVLTIFMLIYLLYYAVRTSLTVSYGGIFINLKFLITAWISLVTVVLFLIRRNKIGALMAQIQSVTPLTHDHIVPLKRIVMISIGGVWIYLAILIITYFLDFSNKKIEDLIFVNYGQVSLSPSAAAVIINTDIILSVYFVRGTLIFIIITYILLCESIGQLFKDLNDFCRVQYKQKRPVTNRGFKHLKQRYQLLAVYCKETDDIFSLSVLLWFAMTFISLCIRFKTIMAKEYSSANLEGWISSIWSIIFDLLIFLGIPLCVSLVTNEVNESLLSIEQSVTASTDNYDPIIFTQLLSFMARINVSPVVFTLYKMFTIRKNFILIFLCIVMLYLIFVVQFDNSVKA